jgi:hypothetical protein
MPDTEIDITNTQLVGSQGDHVVVMMPQTRMSPSEALVHAAWLVTIAETVLYLDGALADDVPDFGELPNQVRNT